MLFSFFDEFIVRAELLQSCPTLCDPTDCSLPGSSVHGILQAKILEWVAIPSSRGSSQSRDRSCVSYVSFIGRWVLCSPGRCPPASLTCFQVSECMMFCISCGPQHRYALTENPVLFFSWPPPHPFGFNFSAVLWGSIHGLPHRSCSLCVLL